MKDFVIGAWPLILLTVLGAVCYFACGLHKRDADKVDTKALAEKNNPNIRMPEGVTPRRIDEDDMSIFDFATHCKNTAIACKDATASATSNLAYELKEGAAKSLMAWKQGGQEIAQYSGLFASNPTKAVIATVKTLYGKDYDKDLIRACVEYAKFNDEYISELVKKYGSTEVVAASLVRHQLSTALITGRYIVYLNTRDELIDRYKSLLALAVARGELTETEAENEQARVLFRVF